MAKKKVAKVTKVKSAAKKKTKEEPTSKRKKVVAGILTGERVWLPISMQGTFFFLNHNLILAFNSKPLWSAPM